MPANPSLPVVDAPAGFLALQALAFGALGNAATAVDGDHPLPIARRVLASGIAPLAGSTAASIVAGPYAPALDRPITLSLSGTWTGTIQVLRSTDGGATRLPLTAGGSAWGVFTANANEPVWEETEAAATFYLQIALVSGSVTYRVAQ